MLKSVGYRRNVSWRRFVEHAGIARKFRAEAVYQSKPDIVFASLPTIELARDAVRFGQSVALQYLSMYEICGRTFCSVCYRRNLRWLGRTLLEAESSRRGVCIDKLRRDRRHFGGIFGVGAAFGQPLTRDGRRGVSAGLCCGDVIDPRSGGKRAGDWWVWELIRLRSYLGEFGTFGRQ